MTYASLRSIGLPVCERPAAPGRSQSRIAIMLPNCPQGVIAYYGTLLVGGIAVMTNPLYVPREIEHQLTDSGASIIVTMDALVERVHKAMERKPLQYTIVTSMKDYLPFPKNVPVSHQGEKRRHGCQRRTAMSTFYRSFRF
ncbi:AMP-binding protein [Paenibacillus sp. JTLBN-2024]